MAGEGESQIFKDWAKAASPLAPSGPAIAGEDVLLVVDMQCDAVERDFLLNPRGGRCRVEDGHRIVQPVCALIAQAVKGGAAVVATKDYHPFNHVSFEKQGGPFQAHCVQGTPGSDFIRPVAEALAAGYRAQKDNMYVAFKGYHEDVDSFAALPYKAGTVYDAGAITSRLSRRAPGKDEASAKLGCEGAPWTGAVLLKQSELTFKVQDNDIDAALMDTPPDMLAMYEESAEKRGRKGLEELLKEKKRLFVCGLPLDLAVLDTCINARAYGIETYLVHDASTPLKATAAEVLEKLKKAGVNLVATKQATGDTPAQASNCLEKWKEGWSNAPLRYWCKVRAELLSAVKDEVFPHKLGCFIGLVDVATHAEADVQLDSFEVTLQSQGSRYSVTDIGDLKLLKSLGFSDGPVTPKVPIPPGWKLKKYAEKAKFLCWAGPLAGLDMLHERGCTQRLCTMLKIHTAPELCFAIWGGFLVLDGDSKVLGVQLLSPSDGKKESNPSHSLSFDKGSPVDSKVAFGFRDRMQEVLWPGLRKRNAEQFCWVGPGEQMDDGKSGWRTEQGGMMFNIGADAGADSAVFFPLKNA